MIRIGVDARPLAHPGTGIGRYTKELLLRLTATTKAEIEWYLYADRPISTDLSSLPNVSIRQFEKWNPVSSLWRTQLLFSSWARRDRLNLFWSPRHHLPLLLPATTKKVVTIHDLVWKLFPETMPSMRRLGERLLMPPSLSRSDAILCISESTRRDVIKAFPDCEPRSRVTYLGSSVAPGSKSNQIDRKYFLFVGTLEPRKNLDGILRAYKMFLQKELEDYDLIIVGGAGWKQDIQKVTDELNLGKNVQIKGQLDDAELHHLYRNATALILVSLYEGFGLPAVEAMQYGVPVIGSKLSSIPEVVGEAGILVDPLNINQISNAMGTMVQDQSLRKDLSELARIQAAKFSWDKTASETLAVFRELVS